MEQDYKLRFSEPLLKVTDISGRLPDFCRYPVAMAGKARRFDFEGATLLQQTIHCDSFTIDIFQLDSAGPFVVHYSLDQQRIFFNFVLGNPIAFTTGSGEHVTCPASCSFYLSAEQAGLYRAECFSDATDLVVVSLNPQWLSEVVKQYPIFREAVSFLSESTNPFDVLPHFRIDHEIRKWLLGVLAFDHENPFAGLAELQKYLIMGLGHYEKLLASSSRTQLYLIKLHIDRNYADPNLDIDTLLRGLPQSGTTVVRLFKNEYGHTIRNYCIQIRLQHAHRLLTAGQLSFAEVYSRVGYSNENSLRKAYKNYLAQLGGNQRC
ncbi:AraC family transcriptional regulator [Sphingobacterium sp.]|uniref:helix-turn-helix domain-containing protein n=1 Tax=Sphingobacterium sp. TaxID=341027 RepID=UPI0031E285A0